MSTLDLSALLHADVIKPRLVSEGKFQAIQELLDVLVANHDLSVRQLGNAREALFRTERAAPSGTSSGLAFPHANVEGLTGPVLALGLAPEGLEFGSTRPSKVILLALLPSGNKSRQSASEILGSALDDSKFVEALAACETAEQVFGKLAKPSA